MDSTPPSPETTGQRVRRAALGTSIVLVPALICMVIALMETGRHLTLEQSLIVVVVFLVGGGASMIALRFLIVFLNNTIEYLIHRPRGE